MNLKNLLSRNAKNYLKYVISHHEGRYAELRGKPKVVVCLGADYGNLGDVAITIAQMKYL